MLSCEELWGLFRGARLSFFTGVPDSTLGGWVSFLSERDGDGLTHRMATIERDAVAWAAGYHVASGEIGVVYTQNSGLGNVVNPITSLADPAVYAIPMLLLVGWRGEPSRPDEPQHCRMGELTLPLLDLLDIRHRVLPDDVDQAREVIEDAATYMRETGNVFALVVRKGTVESRRRQPASSDLELTREEAIEAIVSRLGREDLVVATTGGTSRELFELRERSGRGHEADFLMVGSLGTATSFAAEMALQLPERRVVVLDGDAAFLMSLGALAAIGHYAPANLHHFVLDNAVSDSTGGQPTLSDGTDFRALALASGYRDACEVSTPEALENVLGGLADARGPRLVTVNVRAGARPDLGRPTIGPIDNKAALMRHLGTAR